MPRVPRFLVITLSAVLAALLINLAPGGAAPAPAVKNPDTFVYVGFGDWDTLDYAWAYDTVSSTVIFNVYEPLIFYEGGRTDRFVPMLATAVPSRQNGLLSADGRVYTFPIRQGVRFHDGTSLTAEDAAYSLRRFLLTDRDAGPSALLLEPILGMTSTRDDKGNLLLKFADLQRAVQVKGNSIVVTLREPFGPFLSIVAGWSFVVSRRWAAANGDWDGTAATMARFNNPKKEATAFFEKANGTGPFKLERWDRAGREVVLARHDGYWRTPARLRRVVLQVVEEAATRILMMKAGDADQISLSRRELPQVEGSSGVRVIDDIPRLRTEGFFFTFGIDCRGNPDCGSGRLDGNGIPSDFFTDVHVRRAFGLAFDYLTYIADAFRGRARPGRGMIPPGLLGYSSRRPYFTFDRERAIAEFREAWGGQVWERGFRLTVLHPAGSASWTVGARILKDSIEALNPKFRIDTRGMTWSSYLGAMDQGKLPVFFTGWVADYPDPHNFAFHFLHSRGSFPQAQRYRDAESDRLVTTALRETDPRKREALYAQITQRYFNQVPSVTTVNDVSFRVIRSWVRGWYDNPVFPGTYFYTVWKG